MPPGIHAPGYQFTAYLRSKLLEEMEENGTIELVSNAILSAVGCSSCGGRAAMSSAKVIKSSIRGQAVNRNYERREVGRHFVEVTIVTGNRITFGLFAFLLESLLFGSEQRSIFLCFRRLPTMLKRLPRVRVDLQASGEPFGRIASDSPSDHFNGRVIEYSEQDSE